MGRRIKKILRRSFNIAILIITLLVLIVIAGCPNGIDEILNEAEYKSDAKEMTLFLFIASDNTALSADVVAAITGTDILVTVPTGTDVKALVASFSLTGVSVTVDGNPQESKTNANDFTNAVTYRVTAEDSTYQDYVVTVTIAAAAQYSFALDVSTDGTVGGNIDTANSTANGSYTAGTTVTAQTTVDSGSTFVGWYDAASGGTHVSSANPYSFTLDADTALYAMWTDLPAYTVTFNSQGGSTVDTQTVIENEKATAPAEPVRSGYAFSGWYRESSYITPWDFGNDTVTTFITLYAKWIEVFYINFNQNEMGVAGMMLPQMILSGSSANLKACIYTKTGWIFDGWATTPAGSVVYEDQDSYTMGASTVTLYAKWLLPTVTYNDNRSTGGSIPVSTTNYMVGQTITVLGNTGGLFRTGYSFVGWTVGKIKITTYAEGETFIMGSANVTLYAKWTTNPTYTVTYKGNGNTGGSDPINTTNYEEGQAVTVPGNTGDLVKYTSSFMGWNTQADGNGTTYTDGETFTMGRSNEILYAKWTVSPTYTVTYSGNGSTGGSVPTGTRNYVEEQTVTVLDNTGSLVKFQDGISLRFIGWNTVADGTGIKYLAGPWYINTFIMGNTNITLHAQWSVIGGIGPAGGFIFYDAGSVQSWGRYLEAAPEDLSDIGIKWYNGSYTTTGATGTEIGMGSVNTSIIVSNQGLGSYAAINCWHLVVNNYDDWFLPSILELNHMTYHIEDIGDLYHGSYWSSSEYDFEQVYFENPNILNWGKSLKDETYRVRAVRAF